MMSTLALSSSWPEPANALEMEPAKAATMLAPSTPEATPRLTHQPRPTIQRVAASTIPTTRPASMTSRKTMMSAPSMSYFATSAPFALSS
jgi:hypothetical protein